jgi:hypothetical protein
MEKIKAWSFSRYNDYKRCPWKAKLKHIDRLKEPASPAMERGSEIHKIAEDYLTRTGRSLVPKELTYFANLFRDLRKRQKKVSTFMVVEESWAFKKDWSQTTWDDWNNCWLRIKVDTAWLEDDTTMIVNDWKTGKYRPGMIDSYLEQLELYALAALLLHEHVEKVKPTLSYLDEGITYPGLNGTFQEYTRKDIKKLKKTWEKRVEPMLSDTIFAPKPNDWCRWCYFSSTNKDGDGQCKF